MRVKNIDTHLDTINSCSDFIANATDSDETGIGQEMLNGLYILAKDLEKERYMLNKRKAFKAVRAKQ